MEIPEHRRWMVNRLLPGRVGYTQEFIDGVEEFETLAKAQPLYSQYKIYRCPCALCQNTKYLSSDEVKLHLYRKGFVRGYWYWTSHGEIEPQQYTSNFHQGFSSMTEHKRRSEKFTTQWQEIQSSQSSNNPDDTQIEGVCVHQLSEDDVWISANVTKKRHIYGLGSEGGKQKSASSSSAQSIQSTFHWVNTPEFQELLNKKVQDVSNTFIAQMEKMAKKLEKEHYEKEELQKKVLKIEKNGKKFEKKFKRKLKLMMKMLKTSSKYGASHPSIAPRDETNNTSDD